MAPSILYFEHSSVKRLEVSSIQSINSLLFVFSTLSSKTSLIQENSSSEQSVFMKFIVYNTSGKNSNTFNYNVIKELNLKHYNVHIIEINNLNELIDFMDKCNEEIILTDNTEVCYDLEREGYSKSYVSDFKSKYKYALEIYDTWRE